MGDIMYRSQIPAEKIEDDCYDWYARHERCRRLANTKSHDVVLIGDSITHFWKCDDAPRSTGDDSFDALFGSLTALNLGYGYDRTQNVLYRLRNGEFANQEPRFAVLHIGSNNLNGSPNLPPDPPLEVAAAIADIIALIREFSPATRVILMEVFPRGEGGDALAERIRATNRLLRERFADDPAVIMVDLAPEFGTPTGGIKPELSDDFCHPNAAGYRIWAGKLQEIFERR